MKPPRFGPIPGTNSCSSLSKCSMVNRGYCQDDYIGCFAVPNGSKVIHRAPIINRGYYVRFKAVEYGWQEVLLSDIRNIIITLGCGFDTTPFRYPHHCFIEIDYPQVCREKAKIIQQNDLIPNIRDPIGGQSEDLYLLSSNYVLLGLDLKNIEALIGFFESDVFVELVQESLRGSCQDGINFILFNECSLCYIEQNLTDRLIRSLMMVLERRSFSKPIHCITYLGYEMLRSGTCRNDFGEFLLAHFESLGAPILTFLDENQIQERFTRLNFEHIQMINMKRFCREILWQDSRERERVQSIEPFDEWEELDNVCASYALTICRKWLKQPPSAMLQPDVTNNHPPESPASSGCVHPQLISVFGHCTEYDPDRNCVRIVGGFGFMPDDHSAKHGRLKNIVELTVDQGDDRVMIKANVIVPKNSESSINRIHCRMVRLDDDHILLSGGRTSPSRPLRNSIIKLHRETNQFELLMLSGQNQPPPTYRHVCSRFGHHSGKLIQFGGCHSNSNGSAFVMDIGSSEWTGHDLGPGFQRHSMAFDTFGAHSILVNGGLDLHRNAFNVDNYLELIDQRDPLPSRFLIENFDQKLYSHRMKISGDHEIFIVGGIGDQHIGNQVYRMDFRSMKVVDEFNLADQDGWLMLQNFDCELIGDRLWTIGGGGNCFSFGTHFNPIMSFEL